MRIRFDEQLELLNRKLIEMGALCEDAISASMHTLKNIEDEQLKSGTHIYEMARAASRMVTDSVDSFVRKDLGKARAVQKEDDIVDGLFDTVKNELVGQITEHPDLSGECLDLLMIAKYLERIGDHAVNVAEWVEYSITGAHAGE